VRKDEGEENAEDEIRKANRLETMELIRLKEDGLRITKTCRLSFAVEGLNECLGFKDTISMTVPNSNSMTEEFF